MNAREQFEVFVRRHARTLAMYLGSVVHDDELAADLFQETLLVAWKNFDRFDQNRSFGAWLRGIAAKLVLAENRQGSRQLVLFDSSVLHELAEQFGEFSSREDNLDVVGQCLKELPRHFHDILVSRYAEDKKGPALAIEFAISLSNARKRLQRARDLLLECVESKLGFSSQQDAGKHTDERTPAE